MPSRRLEVRKYSTSLCSLAAGRSWINLVLFLLAFPGCGVGKRALGLGDAGGKRTARGP